MVHLKASVKRIFSFEITPAYLVAVDLLRARIQEIRRICRTYEVGLLAAAKAIPEHDRMIELVGDHVVGFDVSNLTELSRFRARFPAATYSITSPGTLDFPSYNPLPQVMVNATTISQLQQLLTRSCKGFEIGVRLGPLIGSATRIAESRFGLDSNALADVLRSNPTLSALGLHMHGGSRDSTVASKLATLVECLALFSHHGLTPTYVNLGGAIPNLCLQAFDSFLRLARSVVGNEVPLYVEPGEFLFHGAITAIGTVIDVSINLDCTKVILDLSAELHLRWSVPRFELAVFDKRVKQIICGPTCYGGDIISMSEEASSVLVAVGDVMEISNVSSYSLAWNCPFNGVPKAKTLFR